jgi:hypothetical protein
MTGGLYRRKQLTIHAQWVFLSTADREKLALSDTNRCPVLPDYPLICTVDTRNKHSK